MRCTTRLFWTPPQNNVWAHSKRQAQGVMAHRRAAQLSGVGRTSRRGRPHKTLCYGGRGRRGEASHAACVDQTQKPGRRGGADLQRQRRKMKIFDPKKSERAKRSRCGGRRGTSKSTNVKRLSTTTFPNKRSAGKYSNLQKKFSRGFIWNSSSS